ncbi:hypothetical protein ABZ471_38135 [Streptomyces sp. NPDC005728]|uniref:hypothetical protein n=1 Tax=Streptomyces sp. NPDC005728 TaxID=3157054 RepID=UPI003402031F
MSLKGIESGIEHGSMHGYRQHVMRGVPTRLECGCLQAWQAEQQTKAASGRGGASSAQLRWNNSERNGERGPDNEGTPVHRECPTAECGRVAIGAGPGHTGWVRVQVDGSREPARDFCSGSCASYGIALAELRMAVAVL